MAKNLKIKLKRSLIGSTQSQKDTVRCLGLKKRESVVVVPDHPATRGQILKVQHLLEVSVEN
jgi:large subunit ribosomal protein L30